MESLLGGWLVNPALLAAGSLLVSAPIIIHLLSQRRFRTLDWAAMEFLIQAEQRNRRRIQLEELLLLALRCLAVLLAALLVARPYWPSQWTPQWLSGERQEYVVVLDDSPSLAAVEADGSPFASARRLIERLVTDAATRSAGDSLTLVRTSQPGRPLFTDLPLDSATAATILDELSQLTPSDVSCRWDRIGPELQQLVGQRSAKLNRTVAVLTDLRRDDWQAAETSDSATLALAALRTLSGEATRTIVVDVAREEPPNLAIVDILPDQGLLLAGSTVRFKVTVKNFSAQSASNVPVQLQVAGSLPVSATIPLIAAGSTETIPFSYTPPAVAASPEESRLVPLEVRAVIDVRPPVDALAADNARDFAGTVLPGIPTLLIDGDPSSEYGQTETFFLQRALRPPGAFTSGVDVVTLTDAEFDQQPLGAVHVIHLCNLYQMSESRRAVLEQWVANGGGLVIWPGGQIDERHYNADWHRESQGLLPAPIVRMQGDDTESDWVSYQIAAPDHPALRVFQGDAAALLAATKIFRWWQLAEPPADSGAKVVLRFTDAERSPAMIEHRLGHGRVVQLTRSLVQSAPATAGVTVGEPLLWPLDVRTHRAEALLTRPDGEALGKIATPSDDAASTVWRLREDDADQRGVYRWTLTRLDGQSEPHGVAVNLAVEESDLRRADVVSVREAFADSGVEVVQGDEWFTARGDGGQQELWWWVLIGLTGVLFAEQGLAGWISRSRR
jgi:hypothetical protein